MRFSGDLVRERREQLGWSITHLAAVIERSEASVRSIEHGRTIPSMATYLALLEALDCRAEDLLVVEFDAA